MKLIAMVPMVARYFLQYLVSWGRGCRGCSGCKRLVITSSYQGCWLYWFQSCELLVVIFRTGVILVAEVAMAPRDQLSYHIKS